MNEQDYIRIALANFETGLAFVDSEAQLIWSNTTFQELDTKFSLLSSLATTGQSDPVKSSSGEIIKEFSDGPCLWRLISKPLRCEQDARIRRLLQITRVSKHESLGLSLLRPEYHADPLTGVLSRSSFEKELASWNKEAEEAPFALVFLDLDRFKHINDRYGHLEGDACLREIGSRLLSVTRSGDVVGRFGGDEFCLLIAGVSTDQELLPIARRLQQTVNENYRLPDGEQQIGVSMGWAFSRTEASPKQLLHEADRAMYAQKRIYS